MDGKRPKMPPQRVVCPKCGRKKLLATMLRTTHDGRVCEDCGYAAITCHWCYGIVCDWKHGDAKPSLQNMPNVCPNCSVLLFCKS
jgi:ribosomal protein L32